MWWSSIIWSPPFLQTGYTASGFLEEAGRLESVRIQILHFKKVIGRYRYLKISFKLRVSFSKNLKFWYFSTLTLFNSDTLQFWHFSILTLFHDDTFQFRHFSILTLFDSDTLQFWHFWFWHFPISKKNAFWHFPVSPSSLSLEVTSIMYVLSNYASKVIGISWARAGPWKLFPRGLLYCVDFFQIWCVMRRTVQNFDL